MPALARKFAPDPETQGPPKRLPKPERTPSSKHRRKVFHALVLVTRVEEWFVEADNADEARALFATGEGHHSAPGERVHVEIERLLEGAN